MSPTHLALLAVLLTAESVGAPAQVPGGSTLPPTSPTNATAPLAAVSTPADRAGARRHRAQVSCAGGQLEIRADNSSLNSILRSVAQCTGMKITGGVTDQRVYGNYGPAMPSTVLATLLDGTGTNVLLKETAEDQPSELILTPRTGGPTPPSPSQVSDEDGADEAAAANTPHVAAGRSAAVQNQGSPGNAPANGTPSMSTDLANGSGTSSGPVSIPQPINNVMGSPNNTSPNAATYPTTNSVSLDSLPTPSTTPDQTGIVSAPNPPAAGSDTAALLNGRTTNMPGNTTITDQPTTQTPSPGATNLPSGSAATPGADPSSSPGQALTPQQVVDQLQRLRQQQTQPGSSTTPQNQNTNSTPQG